MKWIRGEEIGRGEYGRVCIATIRRHDSDVPLLVAVKSSFPDHLTSLKNERTIMRRIGICPQIIQCYGGATSFENGKETYNLLLELAAGGTLKDQAGRLTELELRRHTRTILEGLAVIHDRGFVHCDIKPNNILVSSEGDAKIADFGLAKRIGQKITSNEHSLRGTPQYIAPESFKKDEYEPPCDVWALGCVVAELSSGEPVWSCSPGSSVWPLLLRIASDDELPPIPTQLSEQGRDFVRKCLIKDPRKRWTVSMLLNHPFVNTITE